MWMPPDRGLDYARKLEREQREAAFQRQDRTGRPSYLLHKLHLGTGRKLLFLGIALVALLVIVMVAAALTSPAAGA